MTENLLRQKTTRSDGVSVISIYIQFNEEIKVADMGSTAAVLGNKIKFSSLIDRGVQLHLIHRGKKDLNPKPMGVAQNDPNECKGVKGRSMIFHM